MRRAGVPATPRRETPAVRCPCASRVSAAGLVSTPRVAHCGFPSSVVLPGGLLDGLVPSRTVEHESLVRHTPPAGARCLLGLGMVAATCGAAELRRRDPGDLRRGDGVRGIADDLDV